MAPRLCLHGWTFSFMLGVMVGVLSCAGRNTAAADQAAPPPVAEAAAAEKTPAAESTARQGYVIPVPLPITGTIDIQVERMIDQALENLPADGPRNVLILEFRPKPGQQGEGTQLDRAKSLARYLVSPKLKHVRTVAYLPTSVQGHAVLPVLACEEIIMAPDATLGDAGHDETFIDPDTLSDYEFITRQRLTIKPAVVRAMLDKNAALYKVQTLDGVQYVLADELAELKAKGAVNQIDTLKDPGQAARFTGRELRLDFGFVTHLVSDRKELAAALHLPASAVEEDPSLARDWQPVLVRVEGPIRNEQINFIIRTLDQRLDAGDANFVCVEINSAGGSFDDSARLAQYLAELSESDIRTVAYVPSEARGDAALIALACDHLVMRENARLGGAGEVNLNPARREDLQIVVRDLCKKRARSWSLPLAMVDRELVVERMANQENQRTAFFSAAELAEQAQPEKWKVVSTVNTRDGLNGTEAEELGLARFVVSNFDELKQIYHLETDPERLQPNWAHLLIEQLARPEIAGFLLFIAFFALMMESMSPGIGVPGFVSAVCFMLYFWANVLHGTAGALEILLFAAGLIFIAMELFILPGFGVFGIGGVLMVIASVILASQTFVIPRNAYQFEQLPRSIMMVTFAMAGVIIALVTFRKYLDKAPMFSRMMLKPPADEQLAELHRRESLASFDHLLHKRGKTSTPLTPAGKAMFGDQLIDVVSDGEFLPRGADVYVIEIAGNRVVVRGIS